MYLRSQDLIIVGKEDWNPLCQLCHYGLKLRLRNELLCTHFLSYRPISIWSEYLFFSYVNPIPSQSQFQLVHLTSSMSQRICSTATIAIYGVHITSTLSCERESAN